jgi:hypothetical protein
MRLALLAVLASMLSATTLGGQEPAARSIMPVFGLHALSTTIAALDVGITFRPDGLGPPFWAPVAGGEIGIAGVQARLGVGRYWPPHTDWGGPGAERTLRLQAAFLRTWGDPCQ